MLYSLTYEYWFAVPCLLTLFDDTVLIVIAVAFEYNAYFNYNLNPDPWKQNPVWFHGI